MTDRQDMSCLSTATTWSPSPLLNPPHPSYKPRYHSSPNRGSLPTSLAPSPFHLVPCPFRAGKPSFCRTTGMALGT